MRMRSRRAANFRLPQRRAILHFAPRKSLTALASTNWEDAYTLTESPPRPGLPRRRMKKTIHQPRPCQMAMCGWPTLSFTHNPKYLEFRVRLQGNEKNFAQYAEPTGGDQIWVRKFSNGAWGQPVAITKGGGDLYRTAVAVDGSGRAWIFWSENHNGNFDIFARAVDGSGPKDQIQISKEAGSDIDPVATTDSKGNSVGGVAGMARWTRSDFRFEPGRQRLHGTGKDFQLQQERVGSRHCGRQNRTRRHRMGFLS